MRRSHPLTARPLRPSDAELLAFVQWCRLNSAEIVGDVEVVRLVMHAYFHGHECSSAATS